MMQSKMQRLCALALLVTAPLAMAAGNATELRLVGQARQEVPNDQIEATFYLQEKQPQPTLLADHLNQATAHALAEGRRYSHVTLTSGAYNTWPDYDRNGKIRGWQGRAEVRLKSRDMQQAAQLVAVLQQSMLMEGMQFSLSDASRHRMENTLIPNAIADLQEQARISATALGKKVHHIAELEIGNSRSSERPPRLLQAKSLSVASEGAVSEPDWQPGQTVLQIQVNGKLILE